MRRIFLAFLLALLLVPSSPGFAAAKKKQQPKIEPVTTVPVTTVEETFQANEGRAKRGPRIAPSKKQAGGRPSDDDGGEFKAKKGPKPSRRPVELQMKRAASRKIDLRKLPRTPPRKRERSEREDPPITRTGPDALETTPVVSQSAVPSLNAPAPAPIATFAGLDFFTWGAGHPPDTVGDVGPAHYIQSINSAVGIYRKSDGVELAAFTLDTLMSQGNFGNICDTENFGDPVILYDTFEDRWIITDFAFKVDLAGNVFNPPGAFQCFAVSMNGDPIAGGWNFYSINTTGGLGDYPKLGVWTDGIYMSLNMFDYATAGDYQGARAYAFNKAQMYAGAPEVQVVRIDNPDLDEFTAIPANARLQTGTPPPGTPNYFVSTWLYTNALSVYKFHVDWNTVSNSTFSTADVPLTATSWPNIGVANPPSQGGATLDSLHIRAMMQNQYTNIGGVESLWNTHTVRRANSPGDLTGFAAPRWYQVDVTGGVVNPAVPQAVTWDPDGANVMHRFMPSLAVDRAGNMALGYSTSSATTKPAIKYAGRLATDPPETFSQTEQVLIQGTGTQTGTSRWGDYAAMTLDPDGCTFWLTHEYYIADGNNYQTRIGSFAFPGCTPAGAGGTIEGTVTATAGGAPISGATVQLGSRTTTTNGSGFYSFTNLPAGTYPSVSASSSGYVTATATSFAVTDGGTTVQDLSLATAPTNACLTDTTSGDFDSGVSADLSNTDITTTPGDVILDKPGLDQWNNTVLNTGVGITVATWGGQTFTPSVSGLLTRVDIDLFCSGCSGTTPNLTVSIRATAAGLPTGADLASATLPGFANGGVPSYFTVTFGAPPALTAGTMYAIVIRPVANPAPGTYALIRSGTPGPYAGGTRVAGATSGTVWSVPLTGGISTDAGFATYMDSGFSPAGTYTSSLKDSNPATGLTAVWAPLTWNASMPANTSVKFQVAASNVSVGPFNFVGPDGTAATFFTTSGASMAQFTGFRYLKYRAHLATTDPAVTPAVQDVGLCFTDTDCSTTIASITPSPAQVCPSSTGNTASGPAGATSYAWSITNGTIQGSTTSQSVTFDAGAAGNVGLMLNITAANGCQVSNSINVPIGVPATPTITPDGPTTFCAGDSVLLSSSSASGNQWYLDGNPIGGETNQTYSATLAGAYTVIVTAVGGCTSASSAATNVTVNPTPATPTITPGGPTTFCAGGSVLLTSSSASGNQWYLDGNPIGGETNQTYTATATGAYTAVVTELGCPSAPSSSTSVTVNPTPATPTITPGGPTTFCPGGSVTLTSSSASGNQWYLDGNPIGGETNQTYIATATGSYTVIVTDLGCPGAPSSATSVTVNPTPATPTITPGGPTTFCAGGSVTLTSSSATGNQWYLDGNPIGGETNQTYGATVTGRYTVVVTTSGCPSAPSSATSVTVNPSPATPTITPGGPTTFCTGGSVLLTSSSASGNQWYLDGNPIGGETNQTYSATATGSYTVIVTALGCQSTPSFATSVTVNPIPATPVIGTGGPTTFCAGGSVTLTSSSANGNQWYLDGNPIGGATNQQYPATLSGDYTVIVTALGCPSAPSSATSVTVNPAPATPTIGADGPTTFCSGGSVLLTSSSATGNQWLLDGNPIGGETNQTYIATASGSYSVVVTASGCPSPASAGTVVTVNPIPAIPVIGTGGPTTFCTGGSVTLTSSSASGNQWYLDGNPIETAANQQYSATATGSYTVVVTTSGCPSTPSAATNVTVDPIPATPTITPGGPTTFCPGGSVLLTSSSATGNQWYLNGNPIGGETNQTYSATATGSYTVVVTASGCPSPPSSATSVIVNPAPATPTIAPNGPTTFCTGGSVLLTSSSASGNQWYFNGNPIGGETNQTYAATATGSYTVIVTALACPSAPSAATSVTVNPFPATPTITPGGPTTFCAGGSVLLTSSSASGNQWYLNGNPIGGEINQTYSATSTGSYTVVVTASGCANAPSEAVSVIVNPAPAAPTITPGGPTTFCAGGSVLLTSNSPSGNQWYLNGTPIGSETNQTYSATGSGSYTVVATESGCPSPASAAMVVTVNPIPATPVIGTGGPTTFCTGGSVLLTSSSASGNQWYLNGNPIGGATNQQYSATASGNYTVNVTTSGCASAPSAATNVTVNAIPATPAITPLGPTSFCTGGNVTLSSSSASGNQWHLNGNPIGGATAQTLVVTIAGDYSVVVTTSGCPSAPSAATTVTVNPDPVATITAPASVVTGSTGNLASVANAGVGATYNWIVGNGAITAGAGTASITFTAGVAGTLTIDVTVTTGAGCIDTDSASVTVGNPPVTVTSVTPATGPSHGGTNVTIAGSGFNAGATVTFGGSAATNVVVVNATQITAKTPAHAAGAVNVVVTNTNTTSGTLTNGYTYFLQNFDPNGDGVIDPADIFYLVAYLFTGGPAPAGTAGPVLSGDANGDGLVDPADIFYTVFYLFGGGPAPHATTGITTSSVAAPFSGAVTLGQAVNRDGRWFAPVIVTMDAGSRAPQGLSLSVRFHGATTAAAMHRGAGLAPVFEISRRDGNTLSYLLAFDARNPLVLGNSQSAVVAEVEVSAPGAVRLELDPALTMLVDGAQKATVANRTLRLNGTAIAPVRPAPSERDRDNH
ncbi:MAG: carboxypeptidase regulatory-like domain-containing protein [Thermoanaerobaculia bacterium]